MRTMLLLTSAAILILVGAQSSNGLDGRSAKDKAESKAAFLEAYKVFTHARCMNCHPVGDTPLQGDDSHPHFYRVRRGRDGNGVLSMRCSNCHQSQNATAEHAPPGAPYPPEKQTASQQNQPRWHLPSAATPLVFEKRTALQLCKQLLDKTKNGGLTTQQLVEHVSHDPLVLWGWNPGEGRTTPPLTHDEFVQKISEWIDKGNSCPN
jgi:hypothetical protein